MSLIESIDVVLRENADGVYDISIDSDGDFETNNSLDASLLRSIYGERRALPSEVLIPELRRGWIGNLYREYEDEDGSKIWLYEQAPLNRKTMNGIKSAGENCLTWLIKLDAAISYSVAVTTNGDEELILGISIQRSLDKKENRFYKLFENTGVTK